MVIHWLNYGFVWSHIVAYGCTLVTQPVHIGHRPTISIYGICHWLAYGPHMVRYMVTYMVAPLVKTAYGILWADNHTLPMGNQWLVTHWSRFNHILTNG